MRILKLDRSFYPENTHLHEALDNYDGNWERGKIRGYGVVIISLNNLKFAIPLRSRKVISSAGYFTVPHEKKGLDYSKAVLISKDSYVSSEPFMIADNEYARLRGKEDYIAERFEKYVSKYVRAVLNSDKNVLFDRKYRHTTLVNYHDELGLPPRPLEDE